MSTNGCGGVVSIGSFMEMCRRLPQDSLLEFAVVSPGGMSFYRLGDIQIREGKPLVVRLVPLEFGGQQNLCEECGGYPADTPSSLCQGCAAYEEHRR